MNQDEKRQMENQLIVMGLKRLTDPMLVQQIALLIPDHDVYLGMLNECDQEKRYDMYHALKPWLRFEPWPLEKYLIALKERADAIASRNAPIEIGERKYQQVAPQDATGVVIDLRCSCGNTASYFGETPLCAVILARQDGWVRDKALGKEVCPKCPSEDRAKRKKCPSCTRRHYPPDCRMLASEKPREKVLVN